MPFILLSILQAKIPLTESEVDDIIITLDVDLDDELVYKELNAGLNNWRKQQRELKKQSVGEVSSLDNITNSKGKDKTIYRLSWKLDVLLN